MKMAMMRTYEAGCYGRAAEGAGAQPVVARMWPRRQRGTAPPRVETPDNEHHHHHVDQLHDVKGLFARFSNALGVLHQK